MSLVSQPITELPPRQRALCERCVHPSGQFIPFERHEIEQSIASRFEQQVSRQGDRLAIKTEQAELTYCELNAAANRIAHAVLAQRRSAPGQVLLLLEQGAEAITAILGTLKAGKAYVPLDSALPRARLSYIADESQAELIVTNNRNLRLAREIADGPRRILNLDEIDPSGPADNPGLAIPPDRLAWIIYTSGSTGQPKGVMQTNRNVLHCMMNYTRYFHICPEDRLSVLFSFATHAGSFGSLLPLVDGAGLFPLDLKRVGPEYLVEWLPRHEITVGCMVPTVFRRFAGALSGEAQFPGLRLLYLAGEPSLKTDFELYRKHLPPDCIFVNRLGSTETDAIRLYYADKQTQITTSTVPVGYAVEDKQVLILDEQGEPAGTDCVGEIVVRSRYISTGYWQRLDLTQAAFSGDTTGSGERTYRTGDLGLMHADGCIVNMGRRDFQVKVRGYRVETAEIDSALLELDEVKDAVVMAREDEHGERRLVAYIVPRELPAPPANIFRHALAAKLPDYMVPAAFVTLPALPHAPNGKIDRRALPAPGTARPDIEEPFVPPRTPTEHKLAAIWTEILGFDTVGVNDDFLDLGSDSLQGTRIISAICASFGANLTPDKIFEFPTIASQAEAVERHLFGAAVPRIPPGSKKGQDDS